MKKISTVVLAALTLLMMAASCSKDEPEVPTPELSVAPAAVSATAEAGDYTITVTGNVLWTATKTAEWLTLTPAAGEGNGAITATVTENLALEPRTTTITITGGELSHTVTVTQIGATPVLGVDITEIAATAAAANYAIAVSSNMAWTATASAEWLTLEPAAGEGNGTITVGVTENLVMETRAATISITAGTLTQTIAVTQEARVAPPYAASSQIWVIGDQSWSDAIHVPECNKDDFGDNTISPLCRSYTHQETTYYYYNWPYAGQNGDVLCPAPWRVPTKDDFIALDVALGGNGTNRMEDTEWVIVNYINTWGGAFGGLVYGVGSTFNQGAGAYYWSSEESNANYAYYLNFNTSSVVTQNYDGKNYGFQVRCVK
jgi:uncharacterized protein (TIGR02145 family)